MGSSFDSVTLVLVSATVGVLSLAATAQQAAAQQQGLNVSLGVGLATDSKLVIPPEDLFRPM